MKSFLSHFRSKPAFSLREARSFIRGSGASGQYLHLMIHKLLSSGELKKITKGHYSFSDDTVVVGYAFAPYYYGLQYALTLHKVWGQATNPVVITAKKARVGLREYCGNNYLVRRTLPKMLFGFEPMDVSGKWVNVSTPEKTLVDIEHFNEKIPRETMRSLLKRCDRKMLVQCMERMPERTRVRCEKLLKTSHQS